MKEQQRSSYERLGVSSSKAEVHRAVRGLGRGLYPNAFCKILPDRDESYCNIMHGDTAGTKAALAYLYFEVTGDRGALRDLPINSIQMNLGDIACVGAVGLEDIFVSCTIDRNKDKVAGDALSDVIQGTEKHLRTLRSLGISVFSCGGETADVGDLIRTMSVAHTAFVHIPRANVIEADIHKNDVVVGLASSGQASWETTYNSGLGSNGYTLARHGVLHPEYAKLYPETYDPSLPPEDIYRGSLRLQDSYPGLPRGVNVGQALLSPTRTYLPLLQKIFEDGREGIHAIIHNTGGGQTKVKRFLPEGVAVMKDNMLPIPPVFRMIQDESQTSWKEMFEVFNCGHLMELYVDKDRADVIIKIAKACGIQARIIGHCHKARKSGVRVKGEHGNFFYPKVA